MTSKRPHPHFDDRGTLDWETRFAAASERARRENKTLFIEMGREACGQCRSLVQNVVPRPDVGPLLHERFVALAADADETEEEVLGYAQELEDAYMLPFVIFVDPQGRFIEGTSGTVNPITFAARLKRMAGVD